MSLSNTKKQLIEARTKVNKGIQNRKKQLKNTSCKAKCKKKIEAQNDWGKARKAAITATIELKDAETKKNEIDKNIKYQEKRINTLKDKLNKGKCTKGNKTCERSRMQATETKKVADEALKKLKNKKPEIDQDYEKKKKDFQEKKAKASGLYLKIPKIEPDLKF